SMRVGISRSMGVVLGTATRFGESPLQARKTTSQEFDIGLDFNRPLTLGRGTTIAISTGSALFSTTGTVDDPAELGRRLRLIGSVSMSKSFGRRWSTRMAYERSL